MQRAASRFDERYRNEKCPMCKYMNQNFIKVSDEMLGCSRCGCMFLTTALREDFNKNVLQMLKNQEQDRTGWVCKHEGCDCGENGTAFKAKTKAGLLLHMKKHEEKKSA